MERLEGSRVDRDLQSAYNKTEFANSALFRGLCMHNLTVHKNEILFARAEELVRITPCHQNAIRFEGFPDCRCTDENFTLMPQSADAEIVEEENAVTMTVGCLQVRLTGEKSRFTATAK